MLQCTSLRLSVPERPRESVAKQEGVWGAREERKRSERRTEGPKGAEILRAYQELGGPGWMCRLGLESGDIYVFYSEVVFEGEQKTQA